MYVGPKGGSVKKGERLVGVCWDDERAGNCDGSHDGVKYFHCRPRQGSFVKSGSLYWEATEDDVMQSLAAVTAELDRALCTVTDDFVEDAVYLLGVLSYYAHFLQSAAQWIHSMIQCHRTIVICEQFLHMPKPTPSNKSGLMGALSDPQPVLLSDTEVRDTVRELFSAWKRSAFDFMSVWACYAPVRRGVSLGLASRFARLAGRMEVIAAESLAQQLERQNSMSSLDDIHSLFGALNLF
jgi:hypothetical protein